MITDYLAEKVDDLTAENKKLKKENDELKRLIRKCNQKLNEILAEKND